MRPTRSLLRGTAIGFTACTLVLSALVSAPSAQAAPSLPAAIAAANAANSLSERLGSRSAGAYFDAATAKMVVTVTDETAAQEVRASGATPKLVARGAAELAQVTTALSNAPRIVGTAWYVDPIANQVVVDVDSTVTGAKLDQIKATVARFGGAVRIQSTPGTLSTTISGGQAIYTGGGRCSLGFNVRSGSTYYFLTAGHCTNIGANWYANSSQTTLLGTRAGSSFPGNDYGIVRYSGAAAQPGDVFLYNGTYRDITSASTPAVGTSVQRSGSTTGVRGGSVTALNATVNYSQGTVTGLIRTTVCAEPGDSGGSLFSGTTAHGLTSGGSGNCTRGGITYYQPVTEALSVYGVSVY